MALYYVPPLFRYAANSQFFEGMNISHTSLLHPLKTPNKMHTILYSQIHTSLLKQLIVNLTFRAVFVSDIVNITSSSANSKKL